MSRLTRSMASLVTFPVLLPMLVSAIPAPDPLVTPAASLDKRANGANIIGYSLSGTSWRTRSCNNGFFSTIGDVGNCCADSSCDFITACSGGFVYYDSGISSDCSNVCGTGYIFSTVGDLSPLHMYNCQSDWTVTETTTTSTTASASVVTTTAQGSTVTVPNTVNNVLSTASATSAAFTTGAGASSSNRAVTLTVTNSDGSEATSISVAAAASGTSTANGDTSSSANNKGANESSHTSNAGPIAGGVVGGVAVLAIIAGIVAFFLWKRKKNNNNNAAAAATPLAAPTNDMPSQEPYPPQMHEAPAWQQQNNYGYGQVPQQGGYQTQDYKMPMAGGGYVNSPPMQQGSQMMPSNHGPQEMYGGPVHTPVELPSQGYRR